MKKRSLKSCSLLISLFLTSQGIQENRLMTLIAERCLSPASRGEIDHLTRLQTQANSTSSSFQFFSLDLSPGLSFEQFAKAVSKQKPVILTTLTVEENILADVKMGEKRRAAALQMITGLVAELHQPMQVISRPDGDGNTIPVDEGIHLPVHLQSGHSRETKSKDLNFTSGDGDIRREWIDLQIEKSNSSYFQAAQQLEAVSFKEIKRWQSDSALRWLWESYRISCNLYSKQSSGSVRNLTKAHASVPRDIMKHRLTQAGIRLAGLLNSLFGKKHVNEAN